ncbi:hypothetical protein EMPS_05261 [Entomortierella parvispora]|uniref:Uncharacterized protein n=1 Tax=Entomortierella parvispora TaxID=205924 RepID=A0A9P3HAP1_9FUNG|nr:hypothetical protein EMPS_05261 [Entomortierella parvispora]
MNPSSSQEAGPSSTPNPQRAGHLHRSPYGTSSPSRPDDSPGGPGSGSGSGSGRQRVRTEPSPRHAQASSGWLGSYNEQPPPMPARSPRAPRLATTPDRTQAGGGNSGSDRILDTHRALGSWQHDGASPSTAGSDGGFRRRNFEPKHNERPTGGQMEPSSSIQSLVESIDDDHVFRLTEMTKKRVEHNNPSQKRPRVVSLPITDVSLAQFQPSEKTLLLSSTCKTSLETRYTQLYQSINDGHPINRLDQLRQLLPRIKAKSIPKHGNESKTSMDQSRPRRPKVDKYKFVDKVEESSCIWDVDHMEARALATEAAEAAQAKAAAKSTSTDSFVQTSSSSRDSFVFSNAYHDSPMASMDSNSVAAGMSPSSTLTSMSQRPHGMLDSTSTFSLEPTGQSRSSKDLPGDSRLRISEYPDSTPLSQQTTPPTITFAKGELPGIQEAQAMESSPSKRSSFLGIFGPRSKKGGHDGSEHSYQESPQSTSAYGSPRLGASGLNPDRRSLDIPQSPHLQPAGPMHPNQRLQPTLEIVPPSSYSSPSDPFAGQVTSAFSSKRTSIDEEHRTNHFGDPGSAAMTDDDTGGHWAPPAFWPQGERMDDSQDESDTALAAAQKRSSIRRLKDKMWKRGPKALSSIHPHPVESNSSSPDTIGAHPSPRVGPQGVMIMSDSQTRVEHKSPLLNPRTDSFNSTFNSSNTRSPLMQPSISRPEKSPMLQPARNLEKSPLLPPSAMFSNEEGGTHQNSPAITAAGPNLTSTEAAKPMATVPTSRLIIDVERIPKRMLDRLKLQPELASVEWKAETVDLSALSVSKDLLTYDEFAGITSAMRESDMYPRYLDDVDVIQLHLAIGQEDVKDELSKDRARKWDHLELRVDQELEQGDKWLKEIMSWSNTKADTIERHCRPEDEGWVNGEWHLDANAPLVEEPAEENADETTTSTSAGSPTATSMSMFSSSSSLGSTAMADQSRPDSSQVAAQSGEDSKHTRMPHTAPLETFKARKQQRDLSLTSTRDMHGSMSSLHATTTTFSFKASLESTRESVAEMRVYLKECRDRLFQLEEATGAPLQEKEPVFKDIVDKFTTEWNGSYFVALKEVEDQIQVMNLKRIENPWMDMLLIMLSWVIRGLFYLVEGVTIMIIIVRHAWRKAKNGYEVIRNTRREQERLNHHRIGSGGHPVGSSGSIMDGSATAAGENGKGSGANGHAQAHAGRTVGAWSSN